MLLPLRPGPLFALETNPGEVVTGIPLQRANGGEWKMGLWQLLES